MNYTTLSHNLFQ